MSTQSRQAELANVWTKQCGTSVQKVLVCAQGTWAAVAQSSIFIFSGAQTFELKQELRLQQSITAAAISSGGTQLVACSLDGILKCWNIDSGKEAFSVDFPGARYNESETSTPIVVTSVSYSKDSDFLAAAGGRFLCVCSSVGEVLNTVKATVGDVHAVTWLSNYTVAAAAGSSVMTWSVSEDYATSSQPVKPQSVYVASSLIHTMSCSPCGKYIAAACNNGTVEVWEIWKNSEPSRVEPILCVTEVSEHPMKQLCWDASGRYLATGCGSEALVWDVQDPAQGKTESIVCIGHDSSTSVTALEFQPSGPLLLTAGDNGQCLFYDSGTFSSGGVVSSVADAAYTARLPSSFSSKRVTAVAWHPNGYAFIATGSGDLLAVQAKEHAREPPDQVDEVFQLRPAAVGQPAHTRTSRRSSKHPSGWGGEPLLTNGLPPTQDPVDQDNGTSPHLSAMPSGISSLPSRVKPKPMTPALENGVLQVANIREPPRTTKDSGRGARPKPQPSNLSPELINRMQQLNTRQSTPASPQIEHQPQSQLIPAWGMMSPSMASTMRWPVQHVPIMQVLPGQAAQVPMAAAAGMGQFLTPAHMAGAHAPAAMAARPGAPGALQMSVPMFMYTQPGAQWPAMAAYPQQYMPYFNYYPVQQHLPAGAQPMAAQPTAVEPVLALASHPSSSSLERDRDGAASSTSYRHPHSVAPSEVGDEHHTKPVTTLYVGNLAATVDENHLHQAFAQYGQVQSIQVIRDKVTMTSKGFGFVTYGHPACAQAAMQNMNGQSFPGPFENRALKVSPSYRRY